MNLEKDYMESEKPLVSLIVVSYNEINHIPNSLGALMGQSYPAYEVIVYDNGSTDGTPEYVLAHYPQVKLIKSSENLGFGGANNAAAQIAHGKYLAFLNCDASVSPNWLEPIVELMERDNNIGCVGAELMCSENPEIILSRGTGIHLSGISYARDRGKMACPGEPIDVGGISGGAFLINREFFLELGGFESLFFLYYEDTDLAIRIHLCGKRCVVVPGARVYHNCESRFGVRKIFFLERNRYLSLFTLMNPSMLLIMMPSMIIFELISWGYCLLRGRDALDNKLRSWRSIYEHRYWIKSRRCKYGAQKVPMGDLLQVFTPQLCIDYVDPNKILVLVARLIGYLTAAPVFILFRLFGGHPKKVI
jgi:GT2 family glycosyltransferase